MATMKFLFNSFYNVYLKLSNKHKSNSIYLRILAKIIEKCIDTEIAISSLSNKPKISNYIISLTSHGKRVNYAYKSIYSILRGGVHPEKIILWLNQNDWNQKNLPENLLNFQEFGLEIRFVKDLGPHTKYFYSFREFKSSNVITIDDDKLYPPKFFKTFHETNLKSPNEILCYGARIIPIENKEISYWKWELSWNSEKSEEKQLLPLGVMGILYPPGFIQKIDELEYEMGHKNYFTTDDLYLYYLSRKNNYPVKLINQWNRGFLSISKSHLLPNLTEENQINNDKNWIRIEKDLEVQKKENKSYF